MGLLSVNVHIRVLKQKYKTSESKKRKEKKTSEYRRDIRTMCLGRCHAAVGARKERRPSDFCETVRWVSIRERSDKGLRRGEQI